MKDKQYHEAIDSLPEGSSGERGSSLSERLSGQWFIPVYPTVQPKRKSVEEETAATCGQYDYVKEKVARLHRLYREGQAEAARYLLFCIDTFDWDEPGGGGYHKHMASLREAVAFERKQLGGIDILVGVLDLGMPFEGQVDQQGGVTGCLFYPATKTPNVIDPPRALQRFTKNIGDELDYIEARAHETGANGDRIRYVLDCCAALRGELDVMSRTAQAMDEWECAVIDNKDVPEGVAVLGVDPSGARRANEKIVLGLHDLAVKVEAEGFGSGERKSRGQVDLLCALVMESASNVFAACADIRHALDLFEQLVDECNSGNED